MEYNTALKEASFQALFSLGTDRRMPFGIINHFMKF